MVNSVLPVKGMEEQSEKRTYSRRLEGRVRLRFVTKLDPVLLGALHLIAKDDGVTATESMETCVLREARARPWWGEIQELLDGHNRQAAGLMESGQGDELTEPKSYDPRMDQRRRPSLGGKR